MRKVSTALILLLAVVDVCRCDRDSCDIDDPTLKKLCRKVESQEKYQEKWVATNFKAEMVFRWYNANKDWLTAARLPRMMKRLLRRANALNPGENDDFADEQPSESVTPAATNAVASAELESKLEQMTLKLGQMAIQLNQTQAQLRQIQQSNRRTEAASSNRIEDLNAIEIRVNASLAAQQERLKIQSNMTEESLRLVISSGEQMANRLSKTEKTLQTIKNNTGNCSCPAVKSPTGKNSPAKTDETIPVDSVKSDEVVMKFQNDMEREIEQLKMKLQLTASDLEKSINSIHVQSEGAMRNFSSVYQEGMKSLASVLEDKVSVASTSSYDVITNATLAFGEDLQILRQAVSSSTAQIQFLIGQDMKSVRGLEELRTGARRHESNIQLLTTQLGEFRLQVQDQMNSIRTHFSQTVNEFYQKIVERQNAMGYRLSSVVDDLSSIKSKLRNIPQTAAAGATDQGGAADNDDDDPLFRPPSLDSR
uniref:Uncharacterized protein n=1 Tax=Daphnia galeata TaxID=27404 RepID=A0A8J2RY32_9CRUS|nr:unnamed protein product [Daphnia galeata]